MTKYKIVMHYSDGESEEQDEMFETKTEAIDYANYLVGCCRVGAETLHWSNPGDHPCEEDEYVSPDYTIIEITE